MSQINENSLKKMKIMKMIFYTHYCKEIAIILHKDSLNWHYY